MKRVMCGKIAVPYQNVEIGKGPGNVFCQTGSKVGQQFADGSNTKNYKDLHHWNNSAAAAWNILAWSICLQAQSPDSNSCMTSPQSSPGVIPNSFRPSGDGDKIPKKCLTTTSAISSLHSGNSSSCNGEEHQEKRNFDVVLSTNPSATMRFSSGHSDGQFGYGQSGSEENDGREFTDNCDSGLNSRTVFQGQLHETRWKGSDGDSSSSSIGCRDDSSCSSDGSSAESNGSDMEVESVHRGGPLYKVTGLQASLPVKRGLSKFWNGKAKSFSSLADVSSIEELPKPERPLFKRRRTASHKSFLPLSRTLMAGISKRPTSTSGSLATAVAMGSTLEESPKPQRHLSALALHSSRSLSLPDLVQTSAKKN